MSRNSRLLLTALCVLGWVVSPAEGRARSSAQRLLPAILSSSITTHKVVALTFDDGPSPYTSAILDILHQDGAVATFFLVGTRVERFPWTVRDTIRQGNELGNHTYSHADLQWLSASSALWQVERAQSAIHGAAGVWTHWFRPPYGAVDSRVAALAANQGLRTVTWSVDPRDWSAPGVQTIAWRVLEGIRPGSIVLLHDGGGNRSQSVAALSLILPALKLRGYRFITLDEMFFPHKSPSAGQNCPHVPCSASGQEPSVRKHPGSVTHP